MIKENIEIKKLYESKINDLYKKIEDEKKKFQLENQANLV